MSARISFFTNAEGGAWRHSLGLARALDRDGFDVELITRPLAATAPARSELAAAGLDHVEVENHEILAAHLLRRRPDIVQHFDSLLVLMAIDLVNQELEELGEARPSSVQLLHANGGPCIPLELTDVVVGVSASTLRWPRSARDLRGRGRVIDNGVQLWPEPRRRSAQTPVILTIARLVDEKAVDVGLRALARLEQRAWIYRIVGDGPARARLEALVDALALRSRVEFVGAVSDPREELEAAEIFLSTSPSEGFGLALAEAAEAGLAIVAQRAGGITEALEHETHALVYDDPTVLASLLSRVLDDADERIRLGDAARRLVHARFDHAAMVRRYEELYAELLGRTRAR